MPDGHAHKDALFLVSAHRENKCPICSLFGATDVLIFVLLVGNFAV